VGQLFALILMALFIGLYLSKDPISHHIPFVYQTGRPKIRAAMDRLKVSLDKKPLAIPPIRIASVNSPQFNRQQIGNLLVQFYKTDQLANECQVAATTAASTARMDDVTTINYDTSHVAKYSVVLCPSSPTAYQQPSHPVLVKQGITYLFPQSSSEQSTLQLLETVFSTFSSSKQSTKRLPLKLSLMVERQVKDWKEWAMALSHWLQQYSSRIQMWPCILSLPIETEVVVSTLGEDSNKKARNDDGVRLMHVEDFKATVLDPMPTSEKQDYYTILLYIPRQSPAAFFSSNTSNTNTSSVMQMGKTLVTTIGEPEHTIITANELSQNEDDNILPTTNNTNETRELLEPVAIDLLLDHALQPAQIFLYEQCMGADSSRFYYDESTIIKSDHTVPQWQLDAWLQRTLEEIFHTAYQKLQEEATWLLQSSTWVVIDDVVADHWVQLADAVEEAYQTMQSAQEQEQLYDGEQQSDSLPKLLQSLSVLESVLEDVETLANDPSLMEPLRFSAPQFLAIFAPLVLPLFLPHFIGLFREWKRYKKLTDASNQN